MSDNVAPILVWSRALRLACAAAFIVQGTVGSLVGVLGDPGNPSHLEYYWAPAFGPMPFITVVGGLAGLHRRGGAWALLVVAFVLVQVQAAAIVHRPRDAPAPPVADWIMDAVLAIQPGLLVLAIAAIVVQLLSPRSRPEAAPREAASPGDGVGPP